MKSSPAFTIVEILIVFAILGIILIPAFSSYVRSRANQDLQGSGEELANVLRIAHIFSRELKDEVDWGVRQGSNESTYELVKDQAVPVVDKSYTLHQDIGFSSNFTIWFQKNDGFIPSQQTIILQNKYSKVFKVTVLVTGVVEVHAL